MTATRYYAAIGDDGARPVVWGCGRTRGAARRDAHQWLSDNAPAVRGQPLQIARITADVYAQILVGVVSCDALGIEVLR